MPSQPTTALIRPSWLVAATSEPLPANRNEPASAATASSLDRTASPADHTAAMRPRAGELAHGRPGGHVPGRGVGSQLGHRALAVGAGVEDPDRDAAAGELAGQRADRGYRPRPGGRGPGAGG